MNELDKVLQYLKENPDVDPGEETQEPQSESASLVNSILEIGESGPVEPEDQFGNPKQLSTIAGLRKKGYDNARIFKAMELEEAESESTKAPEPDTTPEKPKQDPVMYAKKDNLWDRLAKPNAQFFLAGGWKKPIGLTGMALSATKPREEREVYSHKEGYSYTVPEITPEEALIATSENPLYRKGSALFADAISELAERPDLQPSDNFMDYEWYDPEFIAGAIGQALPSFLSFVVPAATTALVTRNPVATMGVTMTTAFGLETGSMMETAMENGLNPRESANVALTVGTINSMISAIPAATLFSKIGIGKKPVNDVLVKSIIDKQLFKDVGTKAFTQGISETLEELLQEGVNIIAETQELGIEMTDEEFTKRLQAVVIGSVAMGGGTGSIAGVAQTGTRVQETKAKIQKDFLEEKITIESQAKAITEDKANDFNISVDREEDGSSILSEDEIIASGYDIDLNNIPVAKEDEYGNKFYAVKIKGETDSEGNIRLTSSADKSTLLEETIEARLKQLQKSKKAEDKRLIEKIEIWIQSVRKKASEMGLELRFSEEGEGNIELFSDAILYTKGGFKGLEKKFEDAIYIPEDISSEFIAKFGEMSDGSSIFEMLKGSEKGIQANQEFASAVDADIASQMEKAAEKTRPPPAKPTTKSKLTKQMVAGDPNSLAYKPEVVANAISKYPPIIGTDREGMISKLKKRLIRNPDQGLALNKRRRFELEGGGVIITGRDKNTQDFKEQVQSILTEDEIISAKTWYEDAYPVFVENFGEEEAIPVMMSWLISNANASPQDALSNTYLALEQLKSELASYKNAGLNAAQVKKIMEGSRAEEGAAEKLYDFADSALGKETRTIMQDDPVGLKPVAVDRHTYRDVGYVDGVVKRVLMQFGLDKNAVRNLRMDDPNGNGPTTTQYQHGVRKVNEWTSELNDEGWMGGNFQPYQIQAIGWTAMAKLTRTSAAMSVPNAFKAQQPTIAAELAFGKNTPYGLKYGDAYSELTQEEKSNLLQTMMEDIVPKLAKDVGLYKLGNIRKEGTGGWEDKGVIGVNPNFLVDVEGSNQAIGAFMDAIGYLLQQDAVGRMSTMHGIDDLGLVFSAKQLKSLDNQELVYRILREETDNTLIPGYSYMEMTDAKIGYNKEPSLVIGTNGLKRKDLNNYADGLDTAFERIRNELGIELTLKEAGIKYEQRENNWQTNSDGGDYRGRLVESHGKSLQDKLDSSYRKTVEERIEKALYKKSEKSRKSRQLVPDPDYAAEQQAAQQNLSNLDLTNTNTWKGFIREKLYDKLDPVVSWQRDVEEQFLNNNRLRDHMNVSLAAELFVGKVPEMLRDFNKQIIDVNNKDSFVYRLNDSGISIEDFNMYLHALHAEERNNKMGEDGLSGMTKQQARVIKSELNKKYGLKNIKAFVKEFRTDIIDASLQMRLDNGLISQEDYDNMKGTYKNYVPLYRVMDDQEAIIDQSKKRVNEFDIKGPEFFKAKGSERKVKNILVSSIEQYHEAVIRTEKNKVNKRMLDLINAFPSDSYEVQGVPHKPVYDENGEIDYMVPIDKYRSDQDYIHVKVDGTTQRIIFKGEQGIKIAKAMKDLGATKGVKYLYAFNNYLRYVNTIADPNFMVTNFVRDVQTAGINISAEQGNAITLQALNPRNLKNAWKGVFKVVQNEDTDSEWSQLYERLRKAGGKTGFFDYQTIEDKVNQVEKDLKRVESTSRGIKVAGKSIFNFVENLNEATESAVRLTLFKAMLDNGYSEEQAASGAKNVTINFNRKGEWGQYLNSMYLFANAGLQGTGRILGVVAKSKKAQAAVATLAALGVTESFYNNMADDDEEYDKLTNWDKDNNFILRYGDGDKFFKIRLPYGYNVFKVVGNIAGDIAWRQMQNQPVEYSKQLLRFLEAANSAFNPVGSGPIEQIISPTAIDPIIQLSTNKAFHGGPIRPETIYGPMKADVEQAWERTPGVYKDMAQWIFKHGNGTIRYNREGGIDSAVRGPGIYGDVTDISPETIEYFVDYLGGGLGKTIARTINTAQGAVNYDADYSKAPFVRTFYGKVEKKSELRHLYDYEKKMKIKVFDGPTRLKYLRYLESFYKKGNLTRKEYRNRYKRFVKAQREAVRNLD